jgi:hypothetical protein
MSQFSSFLFAGPSFAEGAGRLFDVGGTFNNYNYSPSPEQADLLATSADWRQVGMDIVAAMKAHESATKVVCDGQRHPSS